MLLRDRPAGSNRQRCRGDRSKIDAARQVRHARRAGPMRAHAQGPVDVARLVQAYSTVRSGGRDANGCCYVQCSAVGHVTARRYGQTIYRQSS